MPRTNRLKRYGTTFGCNHSLTVKCINLSLYKVKISVYDAWIETTEPKSLHLMRGQSYTLPAKLNGPNRESLDTLRLYSSIKD